MATTIATRSMTNAQALIQRLSRLRANTRRVNWVRGICMILAILLVGGLVLVFLDWMLVLPPLVRAIGLVSILVTSLLAGLIYLVRPLGERVDDLTLALKVEEQFPALNDSLASSVEFLQQLPNGSASGSNFLREETIRRALAAASQCDFQRIVDREGLTPALILSLLAINVIWPLFTFFPTVAIPGAARLLNPFGTHEWPRQTGLELLDHRSQIGRGEPYDVRVRLTGVIPDTARVVFRSEGFSPIEQRCEVKRDVKSNPTGTIVAHLEPEKIQRNFHFQVFANDNSTDEIQVEVLDPPLLVAWNGQPSPQVELHFPQYTDLPTPLRLNPGDGNVDAILGTEVLLQAAANRPLQSAWVEFLPENRLALPAGFLAPVGTPGLLQVLSSLQAGFQNSQPLPAQLDATRTHLAVRFQPRLSGFYVLNFRDDIGLGGKRSFELHLKNDPPPQVTLERPSPTRDTLQMLPTAFLNLQLSVDDPQYAIRTVALRYRTTRPSVPAELLTQPQSRFLSLYDPATALQKLLPLLGTDIYGWTGFRPRPQHLDLERRIFLKEFLHTDGSSLREGDSLVLQVAADDFDTVTPDKQPGLSHEIEIRIIGSNALDLLLNQEQAAVQQELLRLQEKERKAIEKVLEVERRLKKNEKITTEEQNQLTEADQLQQELRDRVGDQEKGLRSQISRIQETLKQNNLQNSAIRERMADVGQALDQLRQRDLPQVESRLTAASKMMERKTQLEEKARDTEKQARLEEETARRKQDAIADSEQQASRETNPQQKERLQAEVERQKQLAQAAQQRAEELKQQARRDRQEADSQNPKAAITDARQHQEEVEKSINELLQRMEPWSSARELKGEAKRLLQEEKQLEAQLEQRKEQLQGKTLDQLKPMERADLQDLKEQQQRLERRMNELDKKMEQMAEERKEKDPETARELNEAREQSKKGDIAGQMKSASEQIDQNRLNQAQENQRTSIQELERLVKNMEDRREQELDRLARKLKEAENRLEELKEEQEKLGRKIRQAEQNPNAEKREEELKQLAREQKRLQEQTQELLKQLTRLRSDRASQALAKAGAQMGQAEEQMRQGKEPEDNQEALDRLNEAQREVQQARKKAEDELQREQLVRVADSLARLKERQESLNAEANRIQTEVQQNGKWTRGLLSSLTQLGESEKGLSDESDHLAEKDLAPTPVFARIIRRAAEAMRESQQRTDQIRAQLPEAKALPDPELLRQQQLALLRLNQVLEAVKEQAAAAGGQRQAQGGDGPGQGGEQQPGEGNEPRNGPEDPGLPPLAQLKLLKTLQMEVNKATEEFKKMHPDLGQITDADRGALTTIRKQQQDVLDLLEEMRRPAEEQANPEGDMK